MYIPMAVWQKPTQHCTAIILQLKIHIFFKCRDHKYFPLKMWFSNSEAGRLGLSCLAAEGQPQMQEHPAKEREGGSHPEKAGVPGGASHARDCWGHLDAN